MIITIIDMVINIIATIITIIDMVSNIINMIITIIEMVIAIIDMIITVVDMVINIIDMVINIIDMIISIIDMVINIITYLSYHSTSAWQATGWRSLARKQQPSSACKFSVSNISTYTVCGEQLFSFFSSFISNAGALVVVTV